MKKYMAILLTLITVLSLCACGGRLGDTAKEPTGIQVGYWKESITPDFSVGMGGMSETITRKSQGKVSNIYLTCIAFREGEETILLYTIDMINTGDNVRAKLREAINQVTKIPGDKIFFGTTHTHSAPYFGMKDLPGQRFDALFLKAAQVAAENAIADLAPATIETAKPIIEKMNFVRHYLMNDGSYAGSNFGTFTGLTAVDYGEATDPQMVLVKFDRGEEKEDVLLINWQAHPAGANSDDIGYYNISADFVGELRDTVEKETGMKVAYFSGAEGNLGRNTEIAADDHGLGVMAYGRKMGEYAIEALKDLKPADNQGLKSTQIRYRVEINHQWDDRLEDAKEVYDIFLKGSQNGATKRAKELGFSSYFHAKSVISRSKMGKYSSLEMNAFHVGDVGFVAGTYEMFSVAGTYIKENSPYDTTFIVTANMGYIASLKAFEYMSYEASTCQFVPGTSEELAEQFVVLLKGLEAEPETETQANQEG